MLHFEVCDFGRISLQKQVNQSYNKWIINIIVQYHALKQCRLNLSHYFDLTRKNWRILLQFLSQIFRHDGTHSVIPPQTFGEEWKFWIWFAWGAGNWLFILPGEESFWLGNEICKFSLRGGDIFEIWKCNNSLSLKHF